MALVVLNSRVANASEIRQFSSITSDLLHIARYGRPPTPALDFAPTFENWATTLLPREALIGLIAGVSVIEPLHAISPDGDWARLGSGWVRLGTHVDDCPVPASGGRHHDLR